MIDPNWGDEMPADDEKPSKPGSRDEIIEALDKCKPLLEQAREKAKEMADILPPTDGDKHLAAHLVLLINQVNGSIREVREFVTILPDIE